MMVVLKKSATPPTKFRFPTLRFSQPKYLALICLAIAITALSYTTYSWRLSVSQDQLHYDQLLSLQAQFSETAEALAQAQAAFTQLQNTDQVKRNETLEAEIAAIHEEFSKSVTQYEELLKLKELGIKTQPLDAAFAKILTLLSKKQYQDANTELAKLNAAIKSEQAKLATAATSLAVPANVPAINEAPSSGYRRQSVTNQIGTFVVDVLAADLNTARVQVETAASEDCKDSCPVAALGDFVARSGGFAGINGPYFCPAEYPSCAGKTNSYDTLIMNKQKTYFNSDNNVHSVVPAFIFSGASARIVNSSEAGRDTGVDAVIAAQPLLLSGSEVRFGGDGDPKKGSRGSRSFIGSKGSTVYIGVVRNATVAEVAHVLKTMGVENALNLDSGGSTAFMANGRYIAGPGRATPFGIVLVRK